MRIAAINTTSDQRRSPSRLMLHILNAVKRVGGESLVVYGRDEYEGPEGIENQKITTPGAVRKHYLRALLTDGEGLGSERATRDALRRLDEWQPDIVHLHNLHGHYINYPMLLKWLAERDIPTVITLHDCWLMTGHCAFFNHLGCEAWLSGCSRCRFTEEYPRSIVQRSARNHAIKSELLNNVPRLMLVPVSHVLDGWLAKSSLAALPRTVITNGIDLNMFNAAGAEKGNIILGVANRWDRRKHLDHLLQLPLEPEERLVIIGEKIAGIESYRNLPQDKLAQWYRRAKVYVNTSTAETFGMTTAEALGCGTPVVVNSDNPLSNLIGRKVPGIGAVTDTSDPQLLRQAINSAARCNPDDCRVAAVEHFDVEAMAQKYLRLYQDMIKPQ